MWVPAHRLLEILDSYPHRLPMLHPAGVRRLSELRSGRQKFVSYETAERILIRLDLEWLRHIPRDQGGLADIYEDGCQYGAPDNLAVKKPRRAPRKYATEEERVAARRRTWREAQRRRMARTATA